MGRAAAESHPTQKDVAMVNMQPQEQRRAKKVLKPALEKRRRDRINESLEKLRILLLESTRNRKFLNPKIEKVEILETAVQYLKKRTQMMKDGTLSGRHYLSGYKDCEQRLANFIDKVHPSDKNHFLTDLQMCVQSNYWRASDLGLLATSQENYHMWSPHDPAGAFYSQPFQQRAQDDISELHLVAGSSVSPNSTFEHPQPCSICLRHNDQLPMFSGPRSCPANCTERGPLQEQSARQKDNPLPQTIWRPWP
ncbi:transcription factor HES-7.1-like [Pleurodeles waltl]|uniref:transcription factor HES-7.1-like n=1 Tax=Pleurodeles waltl TaxID=8319 RepID=UPI0037096363